jgi:formate dehydrogenase subunit gamma
VLLAISGLALFHPRLFFLTGLFGGGENTRVFHPWIGVVLFFGFLGLFLRFWKHNLWRREDGTWMARLYDVLTAHDERLPEVGKYNAGQKVVFWMMSILIIVLITSGLVLWDQYFFEYTTIEQKRLAVLIHSIAAIVIICTWIVHVYAAIWVRGTISGMVKGRVTGGWAWRHHRKWLRELITGKSGGQSAGATPAE